MPVAFFTRDPCYESEEIMASRPCHSSRHRRNWPREERPKKSKNNSGVPTSGNKRTCRALGFVWSWISQLPTSCGVYPSSCAGRPKGESARDSLHKPQKKMKKTWASVGGTPKKVKLLASTMSAVRVIKVQLDLLFELML